MDEFGNVSDGENRTIPWMKGTYRGQLQAGVPSGRGQLQLPAGAGYKGEWLDGKPHGAGTIYYASGGSFHGEFRDGRQHGYGTYTKPNGTAVRGYWEKGQYIKAGDLERQLSQVLQPQEKQSLPPVLQDDEWTSLGLKPEPAAKSARFFETFERQSQKEPPLRVRRGVPAIAVDQLSHWYGKLHAVDEISFEVYPGEILGLLGPNGAGKSTTIKVLTGQLPLKGGAAQILGREVGRDDPRIQSQIGVSFEEKNLYLEMTALENLDFFASLFDIKNPGSLEALQRVGLADRARERVANYSKGMRQRLMIARAFINKPKVLFLDEPTDGLDPVTATAIRKTIKEEAERGAAVLLTTHNMFEADELSDRVAFINEGKIVALDTAENLKLKYGKRAVRVRLRDGDGVREEELPLDGGRSSARLSELAASPDLMTIHTEEATLEAIFIHLTGRRLV
ncbi:MAG: ATP-binding cassette domain-containing protein [Firmicutes bacterium]|nr:ATP-binding cassette domain-containing protein [Bacillota bacterium]